MELLYPFAVFGLLSIIGAVIIVNLLWPPKSRRRKAKKVRVRLGSQELTGGNTPAEDKSSKVETLELLERRLADSFTFDEENANGDVDEDESRVLLKKAQLDLAAGPAAAPDTFGDPLGPVASEGHGRSQPAASDVRVMVYHPKELALDEDRWDTLLVYMHVPEAEAWVRADARRLLDRPSGYGERGIRATRSIAKGAEVTVVPELPGCRFNPPADRFLWLEDAHRREFRVRPDPQVPGYEPGVAVNGRVAFYVSTVLVAEAKIWTFLAEGATGPEPSRIGPLPIASPRGAAPLGFAALPPAQGASPVPASGLEAASGDVYQSIFVSYAREDREVVARLGTAYEVLGMTFLRDTEVLRSGEEWNPRLLRLIEGADIFQLYWSRAAAESRYVRQEYTHALEQRRPSFVRPVYWREPMHPTPPELEKLNFAFLPLAADPVAGESA